MATPLVPDRPYGPRRPEPQALDPVERLLAYEEIRQLASRYALAMDARDLDAMTSLFVEDYRHWNGEVGRAVLHAELDGAFRGGMGGRVGITQVGTHVINLADADHAHGTVYCTAEFGEDDRWVRQEIAYEDTYVRRAGTWYFASRNHELFYGVELEVRPLRQPDAEWPKAIVGRGTVPYRWPSWQHYNGLAAADPA
jgi:hypothetical protein